VYCVKIGALNTSSKRGFADPAVRRTILLSVRQEKKKKKKKLDQTS
jgi:hypothetical protein